MDFVFLMTPSFFMMLMVKAVEYEVDSLLL